MFKNMKLKVKLLVIGIALTVLPILAVSIVVWNQNNKMMEIAEQENEVLALSDLDHIAQGVYGMCQAQQELVQQNVDASLNVARDVLNQIGQITFSEESVNWEAVNQYNKNSISIDLPKMMVGSTWLGRNTSMKESSPVVDKVQKLIGGTCTIFQRMNNQGDMLRVCTNVEKLDGTRAIGTFIPATNPSGESNPVVSKVLRGDTFSGRAYVVNKWYITAYEPILDANRKVVGILYVGIPQESVVSLRQAIMDVKVGETGYVYVLDSQGNYVISSGGKRDGECIWNAKDAEGNLFIQEIVKKAVVLKPGQVAEQLYPWKNANDSTARMKIARLMYFEPWDWVIGVGSYLDEFERAKVRVNEVGRATNWILGVVGGVSFFGTTLIWFFVAGGLTSRLGRIVTQLREGSQMVSSSSGQVSAASQSLAEGATEQAAGLEETSSSLEEMASMTKQNADNAQQANTLSDEAKNAAHTGAQAMEKMNQAIVEIRKSSDETAKIIKVIDEIAFQTNLLALNAAVEAARAGEAGKGFAVVAEEVRNLAMRSAEAAKNTSEMIEESVKNAQNGVDIAEEVAKALNEIVDGIGKTSDLVGEIAAASQEQAQGIDQVNTAVSQMDKITQQNAANAEESASASAEMNTLADSMQRIVDDLVMIVGSSNRDQSNQDSKLSGKSSIRSRESTLRTGDQVFHQIATGNRQQESENQKPSRAGAKQRIPLETEDKNEFDSFND
ncbi:MAG: methyl-accepting chemotaxis protein [Sedimentisphaerales bacterium]|nr:methyl-accepting chemotaxis protein [Sedimentisphaerales bacterium]